MITPDSHLIMDCDQKIGNLLHILKFCVNFKLVNIKWNGKALDNIKSSEGQEISALKRVIEEACGVPSKKQKLLFKGKFLKVKTRAGNQI